jgi:hypothetical protein
VVCRIQVSKGPEGCTIHVAGRLAGAHVDDLLELCAAASGHLRIDLTDLLSVDRTSVEALRHLANTGADLVGVPQYLNFELKSLR